MRLAKRVGRVCFVVGFVWPILTYMSFIGNYGCPLCPHIDGMMRPLDWLQIGLEFGLAEGLIFALLGFAVGYLISKMKRPRQQSVHSNL